MHRGARLPSPSHRLKRQMTTRRIGLLGLLGAGPTSLHDLFHGLAGIAVRAGDTTVHTGLVSKINKLCSPMVVGNQVFSGLGWVGSASGNATVYTRLKIKRRGLVCLGGGEQ